MKITVTVTYEVNMQRTKEQHLQLTAEALLPEILRGPLRTGLDAANAQLEAENKKLRLKLVDAEVE